MIQWRFAAILAAGAASAHEAPSGWNYPGHCCNPYVQAPIGYAKGDCAPVPDSALVEQDGGFLLELKVGDHPNVRRTIRRHIPYGATELYESGDLQTHVCVIEAAQSARCVFHPPGTF